MGELVKIYKDEEIPADVVILKSSKENGLCFVDTMNLDGETNLKERSSLKDI
jgi:P-type E1-E2 ATPase